MKRIIFLVLIVLTLSSCKKNDSFPKIENITSGRKWMLQIGCSPAEVYSQLQQLGTEKNFNEVAIVYRQPFSKPEDVKNYLGLYHSITLQTNIGIIERVLIQFKQDKVSSIETGGAMLDSVAVWPQNIPDENTIHIDDPVDKVYEKLLAIYQIPTYHNYQIILPDKSLEKPFDPDMANYNEWAFSFSYKVSDSRGGTSSVSLFFTNGKLSKIKHEYNEADIYN